MTMACAAATLSELAVPVIGIATVLGAASRSARLSPFVSLPNIAASGPSSFAVVEGVADFVGRDERDAVGGRPFEQWFSAGELDHRQREERAGAGPNGAWFVRVDAVPDEDDRGRAERVGAANDRADVAGIRGSVQDDHDVPPVDAAI